MLLVAKRVRSLVRDSEEGDPTLSDFLKGDHGAVRRPPVALQPVEFLLQRHPRREKERSFMSTTLAA